MTMPPVAGDVPPRARFKVRDNEGTLVGTAELRKVPVDVIKIDSSYQRDLDQRWVNAHLPWDPRKAQAVILSDRAGGPYCVDGQHRLAIAREGGVAFVHAIVVSGLTRAGEARAFVGFQRDRRALKSWDLFKAELSGDDPTARNIVAISNHVGFRVEKTAGDNHIAAVEALKRTYKLGGELLLRRVLGVLRARWFGESKATSGLVIYGLALFFHSAPSHPQYDEERFARIVASHSPSRIVREAQAVADRRNAAMSSASNVAEALFDLYNAGLKPEKRLPKLTIGGKRRPTARVM